MGWPSAQRLTAAGRPATNTTPDGERGDSCVENPGRAVHAGDGHPAAAMV